MKFHTAPKLETERLILRPHTKDDWTACHQMWSNSVVTKHTIGRPSTEQETWFRMMRYLGHWQMLGFGYWAVENKKNNQYIGDIGFADFKRDLVPSIDGIPELGWALRPEFHGKGLATEALKAVLDWTDQEYKWKKTVCIINPDNLPSIRVSEKCGYQKVGPAQFNGQPVLLFERLK